MPGWDPQQYLKFERDRSLAVRDLVARLALDRPTRIVDLGCGTGTSTRVLHRRWPRARLTGVDQSPEMLREARAALPSVRWVRADLRTWAPRSPQDLVFSNAALQWLPDHRRLLPRLWRHVAPGGALAFQVPAPGPAREPWARARDRVLRRPGYRRLRVADPVEENVLSLAGYYDRLAPGATRVELWDQEYGHVLPGPESVVEWTKGTALRPVLAKLRSEEARADFTRRYATEIARTYRRRRDGRVLFPFLRRFVIAYRGRERRAGPHRNA